jgi:hypothetical protein
MFTVRGTVLCSVEACGLPVCRGTTQKLAVRFVLCQTQCHWSVRTATDRTRWDSFYCAMLYFVTENRVCVHSRNARCRKLDSRISSFEEGQIHICLDTTDCVIVCLGWCEVVWTNLKDFSTLILCIYNFNLLQLPPRQLTHKLHKITSSLKMTKNWSRNMSQQ